MKQSNLEMNYIAIQILYFLNNYEYSPNSIIGHHVLVKMINGEEITLTSAYRRLKKNISYVDEDLIDKINSHPCIFTKLSKDNHD